MNSDEGNKNLPPHVLIFPMLLQGHLNSMLNLAQFLCLADFHVTFIFSKFSHRRLLRHTTVPATFARYPGFQFRPLPDGLPDDHPRAGMRTLELLDSTTSITVPLFEKMMAEENFLASAARRPVTCLIADGLMGVAADFAEENGLPLIHFQTATVSYFLALFCFPQLVQAQEIPFGGTPPARGTPTAPAGRTPSAPGSSGQASVVQNMLQPPHRSMPHAEKPEKFNGLDFKRWQQKMLFYLTTLGVAMHLKEDPPLVAPNEQDPQVMTAYDQWHHGDFLCKNYILNGLVDGLYSVYSSAITSRELWEALERKYKTEDAGTKKFVVAKFLDFKMVDTRPVMDQVQELQLIVHDVHAEGMVLSDAFTVAAVIEKLPPCWKDFKSYLKHKRKEMTLEDLVVKLRIEADNRKTDLKPRAFEAKANLMERGESSRTKKCGRPSHVDKEKKPLKRFKGMCFNCDKPGHMARQCTKPKKKKGKMGASVVEQNNEHQDWASDDLAAVVFEANHVDNPKEWFVDTGATCHVYSAVGAFSSYKKAKGRKVHMGNQATSEVAGFGSVVLKLTSGMELTL